jgi:hypothetical protein
MSGILPKKFVDLEYLVTEWALATQNERQTRRARSNKGEMQALYDALQPKLDAILEHVDEYPLGDMPPDTERLFFLALMLAEIAPHVELYGGDPNVPHSFDETRFVAVHGDERG